MMRLVAMMMMLLPLAACADPLVSKPDLQVYIPGRDHGAGQTNQHFLVVPTVKGNFLAFWTTATRENDPDQRVVMSRSDDRGKTWTSPRCLAGAETGASARMASWGFPFVVPGTGRVYLFWNQNVGITDAREDTTGALAYRWSDDEGATWSDNHTLTIRKSAISNPEPGSPPNWVTYQVPIITPAGDVLVGFTRWASTRVQPEGGLFDRDSELWFLRFDNILSETDGAKLKVTTLPDGDHGVRVPRPDKPKVSVAQEPSVQPLSGGRLITVMRTRTGFAWFALSSDGGHSWSEARPLRYRPGGDPVRQPLASCPLYRLQDGRYLLIFHNNSGDANGGQGVADSRRVRRPVYVIVGRENGDPNDPITFDPPRLLADNGGVPAGVSEHTQIGTYPSLFEFDGKVYFWYPDRKHYLLGKILGADLLPAG